jgi:hypothetical protein
MFTEILQEQTTTETIQSHFSRLARKLDLKSQLIDNCQMRHLGQCKPSHDKYRRMHALLMDKAY